MSYYKQPDVLRAERTTIGADRPPDSPWIGLCLSGGGIRSATFSVGIMQGLAQFGLLQFVDYISAVSGGGYAAAWLSAWIARDGENKETVFRQLSSLDQEPLPVRHLRLHSTYLAERISGMGGRVMWSLMYLWNLLLYWSLLLGIIATTLMLPALYIATIRWEQVDPSVVSAVAAISSIILGVYVVLDHPGFRDDRIPFRYFFVIVPGSLVLFGYSAAILIVLPEGASENARWGLAIAYLFAAVIVSVLITIKDGRRFPLGPFLASSVFYGITACLLFSKSSITFLRDKPVALVLLPSLTVLAVFVVLYFILHLLSRNSALELDWLNTVGVFVGLTMGWMLLATSVVVYLGNGTLNMLSCGISLVVTLLIGQMLDVNQLSLHTAYRHRLVGAYLAASHKRRRPHPLTELDYNDDQLISKLPVRPFLLFNMAAGSRASERGTEAFTVSKLYAGSSALGYRETSQYVGGLSLGTAIAISGAAIDPERSSDRPLTRFFLKLLNARLGVWFPSPAKTSRVWNRPRFSSVLRPLIFDILGIPLRSDSFVTLTDGGYFDNLGLYAMVERKPDLIVVVDATEDPDYVFKDLGSAMQRVRSDLNARIKLNLECFNPKCENRRHSTSGTIQYEGGKKALLIYIKPMVLTDDPEELLRYKSSKPLFPQQPTVQQLFDEWQFESYRTLGVQSADASCGDLSQALINEPITGAAALRAQLLKARQASGRSESDFRTAAHS